MARNTVFLTVTVSRELSEFVKARVSSGAFVSQSEVVRAALRALRRVEPEDPWAGSGGRSSSPSPVVSTGTDEDSLPEVASSHGRELVQERLPELYRHRHAVLRLFEEHAVENPRISLRDLRDLKVTTDSRSEEEGATGVLRIVVDPDPERIYPDTAKLAARLKGLFGRIVWLDEESLFTRVTLHYRDRFVWLDELIASESGGAAE